MKIIVFVSTAALLLPAITSAKPEFREAFFKVFPEAIGSRLDNLPSRSTHCGVCHYDFSGGGTRNPWGISVQGALGNFPKTEAGRSNAVYSVRNIDSDGDGYSSSVEVASVTGYSNTPTFPGLTPSNVGQVSRVAASDIQNYLVPLAGGDTTPPSITVTKPNGGESFTANRATNVLWSASDASGISGIDIFVSLDGGASYQPVARGLANTGTWSWPPANRPTTNALIRIVATDNASNTNADRSDSRFQIIAPAGGRVSTTLRDFDLAGTQPFEAGADIAPPENCASCHGNYAPESEPYFNWKGSMMALASRDPLFLANMTIANQDAPDSGDLCLRCHLPRGWLQGRSVPTDGSRMVTADHAGVSCDICHRMVDPIRSAANPVTDSNILAALSFPGTNFGNGMMVIDPSGTARGPFSDAMSQHAYLVSPFHREAALCGTCHDVSNPAFQKDALGNYVPNAFNASGTNFSAHSMLPVERTYSEWFFSAYNTASGIYAPQFAGNKADGRVATCQDCHMRDVAGRGADPISNPSAPLRQDLPLHDMTGGSTWLPGVMTNLFPTQVDAAAVAAGVARAQYMLANAATLGVSAQGGLLKVSVTNQTGHKLPTGYPEGRRIWINVKLYNLATNLVAESGAYDPSTGVLTHDDQAKVYEVKPGIETNLALALGLPPGPSFHFVLNNQVFLDNRIPPRGFTNSSYAAFGGAPVAHSYADGQHWDETVYTLPPNAAFADVRLYYQSTSKEFIEFLRDENVTDSRGADLFNLWNTNGKCPPTMMAQNTWVPAFRLLQAEKRAGSDGVKILFQSRPGVTYTIEYTDVLGPSAAWSLFAQRGTIVASTLVSEFQDDFTANTSGSAPPTGTRYYRFRYTE
jgi:hypothetical protein